MEEGRNNQVIREFTRIFKNEHNVYGVARLFDADLSLSSADRSFPWA